MYDYVCFFLREHRCYDCAVFAGWKLHGKPWAYLGRISTDGQNYHADLAISPPW